MLAEQVMMGQPECLNNGFPGPGMGAFKFMSCEVDIVEDSHSFSLRLDPYPFLLYRRFTFSNLLFFIRQGAGVDLISAFRFSSRFS